MRRLRQRERSFRAIALFSRRQKIMGCASACISHGPLYLSMDLNALKAGSGQPSTEAPFGFTQLRRNPPHKISKRWSRRIESTTRALAKICPHSLQDTSPLHFLAGSTLWMSYLLRSTTILCLKLFERRQIVHTSSLFAIPNTWICPCE